MGGGGVTPEETAPIRIVTFPRRITAHGKTEPAVLTLFGTPLYIVCVVTQQLPLAFITQV